MIDGWLNQIANVITNNLWLAPILALLAGILTSFLPCSLTNIPLIIGYVGGTAKRIQKRLWDIRLYLLLVQPLHLLYLV